MRGFQSRHLKLGSTTTLVVPTHSNERRDRDPLDVSTSAAIVKNVNGGDSLGDYAAQEDPSENAISASTQTSETPQKKKAGVKWFVVYWSKHPDASATLPKLRLDYTAKFRKNREYDPSLAEFGQNVAHEFKITEGPNRGRRDSQPLQDDGYSRKDDTEGHSQSSVKFVSDDNPGTITPLDPADVIEYSFTAEQMIIDTSDGNKVIARRGPHTAIIKGKHERTYQGVPKTLA